MKPVHYGYRFWEVCHRWLSALPSVVAPAAALATRLTPNPITRTLIEIGARWHICARSSASQAIGERKPCCTRTRLGCAAFCFSGGDQRGRSLKPFSTSRSAMKHSRAQLRAHRSPRALIEQQAHDHALSQLQALPKAPVSLESDAERRSSQEINADSKESPSRLERAFQRKFRSGG